MPVTRGRQRRSFSPECKDFRYFAARSSTRAPQLQVYGTTRHSGLQAETSYPRKNGAFVSDRTVEQTTLASRREAFLHVDCANPMRRVTMTCRLGTRCGCRPRCAVERRHPPPSLAMNSVGKTGRAATTAPPGRGDPLQGHRGSAPTALHRHRGRTAVPARGKVSQVPANRIARYPRKPGAIDVAAVGRSIRPGTARSAATAEGATGDGRRPFARPRSSSLGGATPPGLNGASAR